MKPQKPKIDLSKTDDMIEFGFQYKDYNGELYFIPTEDGGYSQNPKNCTATKDFLQSFANYCKK